MDASQKEGYLYKYRNFPKKWLYRYFKLNKTYLQFYETQHVSPVRTVYMLFRHLAKGCSLSKMKKWWV